MEQGNCSNNQNLKLRKRQYGIGLLNVNTIPCFRKGQFKSRCNTMLQEGTIQTQIQYLVLGRDNSNVDTIPCFRNGQFKRRYNTLFQEGTIQTQIQYLVLERDNSNALLYSYNFNPIKNNMVVVVFRNQNRQNEIQSN